MGSKQLAALLEKEGFIVRVHDSYFKPDEADDVWLASCGQRGWVAITPDKRILKDASSMAAIGANNGRVLFLPRNNKNPQLWAPILVSNWTEIKRALTTRKAPFVANVSVNGIWGVKELSSRGTEKKRRKARKG